MTNNVKELTVSEMSDAHCIITKINQSTIDEHNGNVYEAARYAWVVGQDRLRTLNATEHYIILAVVEGIVKGVYTNVKWKQVTSGKDEGRYEYEAEEADQATKDKFMNKLINSEYRKPGKLNSIMYTWKK